MSIEEFVNKLKEKFPKYNIYHKKDVKWYIVYVLKYPTSYKGIFIVTERMLRSEEIANKRLKMLISDIKTNT